MTTPLLCKNCGEEIEKVFKGVWAHTLTAATSCQLEAEPMDNKGPLVVMEPYRLFGYTPKELEALPPERKKFFRSAVASKLDYPGFQDVAVINALQDALYILSQE